MLQIRGLSIDFTYSAHQVKPGITSVDLTVRRGETVGLVGESGCGKTLTALAVMGLLPDAARVSQGEIRFNGQDLLQLSQRERNGVRGAEIGMVFQDAFASLSPYYTVGSLMTEGLRFHQAYSRREAYEKSVEWLRKVGLNNPEQIMKGYPQQLSGGMRQRVLIAMTLSLEPSLLIADEPTTALDVTTQAEILDLLRNLQQENGMSMIFVSHDLSVVAHMCERTVVMYAGQTVEEGKSSELFHAPKHPYTKALIAATPRVHERQERFYQIPGQVPSAMQWGSGCRFFDRCHQATELCKGMPGLETVGHQHKVRCWHGDLDKPLVAEQETGDVIPFPRRGLQAERVPILSVRDLKTWYSIKKGWRSKDVLRAVDGVSFDLYEGETLALVGESGCGKSTTGRSILRLVEPTAGEILFAGERVAKYSKPQLFAYRRNAQIVYQDPYQFLDPRRTVGETLIEPMEVHNLYSKSEREAKVTELLEAVGLSHEFASRYPHELSGGQKQRIGIARAISLNPKIIVADEPVSALDVSVQAQVLNLFQDLKVQFGLSYLFISHDLSVVRNIADRVAVMYLGKIVEIADSDSLFRSPAHPYTQALLSAVPQHEVAATRERITLQGESMSQSAPLAGCSFQNRCPFAIDTCKTVEPLLRESEPGRFVACHL